MSILPGQFYHLPIGIVEVIDIPMFLNRIARRAIPENYIYTQHQCGEERIVNDLCSIDRYYLTHTLKHLFLAGSYKRIVHEDLFVGRLPEQAHVSYAILDFACNLQIISSRGCLPQITHILKLSHNLFVTIDISAYEFQLKPSNEGAIVCYKRTAPILFKHD